jgi:hypothetical protein
MYKVGAVYSRTPLIQIPELQIPPSCGHMHAMHWNRTLHYAVINTYIFNPRSEDISLIRTVLSGLKVSGIEELHCMYI